MKITNRNYVFRPVVSGDLQLLSTWLKDPIVSRWYEDPDYIDNLVEHLEDSRIRMQLVLLDETPIAFVQDYDIHAWADHHLAYLPRNSRGIDTFIGSFLLSGRGHGTNADNTCVLTVVTNAGARNPSINQSVKHL